MNKLDEFEVKKDSNGHFIVVDESQKVIVGPNYDNISLVKERVKDEVCLIAQTSNDIYPCGPILKSYSKL